MATSTWLPAPLTDGHLCPDCNGTGADAKATFALRRSGQIDSRSYVGCRNCHSNGLDPAAYFRWSTPQQTGASA